MAEVLFADQGNGSSSSSAEFSAATGWSNAVEYALDSEGNVSLSRRQTEREALGAGMSRMVEDQVYLNVDVDLHTHALSFLLDERAQVGDPRGARGESSDDKWSSCQTHA